MSILTPSWIPELLLFLVLTFAMFASWLVIARRLSPVYHLVIWLLPLIGCTITFIAILTSKRRQPAIMEDKKVC